MKTQNETVRSEGVTPVISKLPWSVSAEDNIWADDGKRIANTGFTQPFPNAKANAAFIVKCCNYHETMLSLLNSINRSGLNEDNKKRLKEILEQGS